MPYVLASLQSFLDDSDAQLAGGPLMGPSLRWTLQYEAKAFLLRAGGWVLEEFVLSLLTPGGTWGPVNRT